MALTKKLIAYASLALGIGLVVVGALMLNIPAGLIVCGSILLFTLFMPDGWRP
jgi:hypothetical protein